MKPILERLKRLVSVRISIPERSIWPQHPDGSERAHESNRPVLSRLFVDGEAATSRDGVSNALGDVRGQCQHAVPVATRAEEIGVIGVRRAS